MAEPNTKQKEADPTPCEKPKAAIEAILFAAGHPISYETLANTLHYTKKEIRAFVKEMLPDYDGRGILLLAYDDGCQLATREQFLSYIREALGIKRGGNLSASSMEVLAIVAYNQPVTRAFIDAVRGVDSSYAVSSLAEKELIAISGRLDAPGRPALFCTTDKFLRVFGLRSLSELPPAEELIAASPAEEAENGGQALESAKEETGAEEPESAEEAEGLPETEEQSNGSSELAESEI